MTKVTKAPDVSQPGGPSNCDGNLSHAARIWAPCGTVKSNKYFSFYSIISPSGEGRPLCGVVPRAPRQAGRRHPGLPARSDR